jgi:hypothetical protein
MENKPKSNILECIGILTKLEKAEEVSRALKSFLSSIDLEKLKADPAFAGVSRNIDKYLERRKIKSATLKASGKSYALNNFRDELVDDTINRDIVQLKVQLVTLLLSSLSE